MVVWQMTTNSLDLPCRGQWPLCPCICPLSICPALLLPHCSLDLPDREPLHLSYCPSSWPKRPPPFGGPSSPLHHGESVLSPVVSPYLHSPLLHQPLLSSVLSHPTYPLEFGDFLVSKAGDSPRPRQKNPFLLSCHCSTCISLASVYLKVTGRRGGGRS
jgi:hypothetical protein